MKSWLIAAALLLSQSVAAEVLITDVWSRATPPGTRVGVVYATLLAKHDDELLSIETANAARAEVHTSISEGGIVKMRQITSLSLSSNLPLYFKPGGTHIMLVDLQQPLSAGTAFTLTFRFRNAPPVDVVAKVLASGTQPSD